MQGRATSMTRNALILLALVGTAACSSSSRRGEGTISLTWDLADAIGQQIDCEDVDAVTLQLVSTPVGTSTDIVDLFDCTDYAGTTNPLPDDDYHVTIDLLDSNDNPLNDVTPTDTFSVIANTDLNIGNFVFAF